MTRLADRVSSEVRVSKLVERKLKITVLSGGPSSERQVSLKSGEAVANALEALGHDVYRADIGPGWFEALKVPADMVFIALHGTFGEDGQLQQILDDRGIRYCGSGPAASALAMDKVASKCRFIEANIPTPRFDVVTPDRVEQVCRNWVLPAVIKPVDQGSSVDCRIVRDAEELRAALRWMAGHYRQCLIEQYIDGPELTVGILGDSTLPPIQICTRREFYNYEAKYLDEETEYRFDIDLPASLLGQIESMSLKAHRTLGCRDFSRVDWIVDARTHQPYVLEVNTIPGFTDHSLLPKAANRAGLSFEKLCQRIIELACERS